MKLLILLLIIAIAGLVPTVFGQPSIPTIQIISPSNGDEITGTVITNVIISNNIVEYDIVSLIEDSNNNLWELNYLLLKPDVDSFSDRFSDLPNGTYTYRVIMKDLDVFVTEASTTFEITEETIIDTPTIQIISPSMDDVLYDDTVITNVAISDNIDEHDIWVTLSNSTEILESNYYYTDSFSETFSNLPDGAYTYLVILMDEDAFFAQEYAQFTIDTISPPPEETISIETKKKKGGSSYNPPPTLGVDNKGKRIVENGFSYNGNATNVDYFHTEYPLITTEIGKKNTVEVIVYENRGMNNLKWVQLFLGVPEVGKPLSYAEVTGQLILSQSQYEEFNITDKQNLIQNFNATSIEPHKCKPSSNSEACLKIIFEYEYREAPLYNIMAVSVMDVQRAAWAHYFNDGVEVIGESLNEPPTDRQFINKQWIEFVRTDKVNHIWTDQNGIEYLKSAYDNYDRITPEEPIKCITPDVLPKNGGTRADCWWRAQLPMWSN